MNEYIDGERKKQLSRLTNIPEQQIKVWFQNRRQKKKREVEEMQQQALQQERIQQVRISIYSKLNFSYSNFEDFEHFFTFGAAVRSMTADFFFQSATFEEKLTCMGFADILLISRVF